MFFLMKSIAERWYENWYLSLQEIRLPTKKSDKIILTNFTYFLKRLGETTGYENCTIKSYELFVIFYLINIITSDSIPWVPRRAFSTFEPKPLAWSLLAVHKGETWF